MELKFEVYAKIARPLAGVFEAVVNPEQLSAYFTTGGANGPLAEGATVLWKFGDYPHAIPVRVSRLVPNQRIEFGWEAEEGAYQTAVVMTFEPLDSGGTLVRVAEGGWRENPTGLRSSYLNCGGWMQMLCCLKAWTEHGINLRRGFF
ncbi:MAG: SRPBCC domain-containing protein [Gammaproteobacteria bacterium]